MYNIPRKVMKNRYHGIIEQVVSVNINGQLEFSRNRTNLVSFLSS
jgi:hypothetical protein